MRRFIFLAVAVLTLALLAAPLLAVTAFAAPAGKTVTVNLADYEFQPKTLTIDAGDTVTFTNTGSAPHSVDAGDGSWTSGNLDPGKSFSRTFDSAGTFKIYCKYHGSAEGAGMAFELTVKAAAAATPEATAQPAAGPTPSLEASDQALKDGTITVAKVVAAEDGWIEVHENTADNKPGTIIGGVWVPKGESMNVSVKLETLPKAGDKLWPMLHVDKGQPKVYEFPGPDAPVIVNGDIIMKQITVMATATAEATPTAATEATPAATAEAAQELPATGGGSSLPLYVYLAGAAVLAVAAGATLRLATRRNR